MAYSQENRFIAIDTPLGKDVLLLASFKGTEGLSRLFSFELGMISENHAISFEDIIGKNVTISVVLADQDKHYLNGIISRFSQGRGGGATGGESRFSFYRATMAPWPWLLTRTSDSRIFQKLSVPEIVEKIFKEKGFSDFKLSLHGTYNKRDYCVQYRETDFSFISRLMEDEGIHYFFEHAQGKHILVLADDPGDHKPCPKQNSAGYQLSAGGWLEEDVITGLEAMQEIRPAKYSLNDYNFEMPNTSLLVNVTTNKKLGPGEREIYDHPGLYSKKAEGDRVAKIRMEEEEAQITKINGSSNCRAFTSGYRFTLKDFYRSDINDKEYALTFLEHEAAQDFEKEAELAYANHFTCIPADVPFRPVRATEKPGVHGTQTAIVVGPAGDEIYTDDHGRVKVQFHWDREGKKNENSSCWIRVSHAWAGEGWGAVYLPRIGQEVIVDFLEGDPDRPIITGRVYHGTNKPPYQLPNEKTKSTIKSNSSLGGGGSNELRFEDNKGSEEVFLHGQKDWTIVIENDKNQKIGHDETLDVGNNRTKKVGKDQSEDIGANKTIVVGKNHTESISENASIDVGKDESVSIGKNQNVSIGENISLTVGKDQSESISNNANASIGKNLISNIGENFTGQVGKKGSVDVGEDLGINVGKKLNIKAADQINITSDKQIVLKAGDASITLKKNGDIVIKGNKISIKASSDLVMKGSKITQN